FVISHVCTCRDELPLRFRCKPTISASWKLGQHPNHSSRSAAPWISLISKGTAMIYYCCHNSSCKTGDRRDVPQSFDEWKLVNVPSVPGFLMKLYNEQFSWLLLS